MLISVKQTFPAAVQEPPDASQTQPNALPAVVRCCCEATTPLLLPLTKGNPRLAIILASLPLFVTSLVEED